MTTDEIKNLDAQCVMQTYGRFDVAIDHGSGATLYSPEGKEYIDFASGIGVNSIGYGDKKWVEAITAQALKLPHISNLYYSEPYARLAEILTKRTGMTNVFFANSGAEANEGMLKLARKYSFDKYAAAPAVPAATPAPAANQDQSSSAPKTNPRSTIITLYQSFHGRTITTLAATGQDVFHNYFYPFTEGFKYVPAGDIYKLQSALTDDVCAVMLELIQGEGGVLPLEQDYVKAVAEKCKEKDILLLIDEVQTGVGRCGTLFAFQQYGIKPDALTFAKGIAGGLPMGGILASDKCADVLTAGTHATTFGGNPIAAAGAIEVLSRLDAAELKKVTEKGDYIRAQLTAWDNKLIKEIRGKGLMLGISLTEADSASVRAKAKACADNGLLILTAGDNALRMLPPLTISTEEIDKGLSILKAVLSGR